MIFDNTPKSLGRTPLIRLNRLTANLKARVIVKVESSNPSASVKYRPAVAMIEDAEARGVLKPGMTIVEPTSGNTGIALALAGAAKGYRVTLAMPETMSIERRNILKAMGAELLLTPAVIGMKGAIDQAIKLSAAEPERYFMPDQFSNPANPAVHERTTGPEITQELGEDIAAFVASVGTGGTLTGTTRWLKKQFPNLTAVAVEPEESPLIRQTLAGEELKPAPHGIQGIGANFLPANLDLSLIDRVIGVSTADAMRMGRRLTQEEGIFCGISSGAAVAAALSLAKEEAFSGKNIVVILPDTGERYLSTGLFDG